jgi:preprotein translocase subunit YajC
MKKTVLFSFVLISIVVMVLLFIRDSNDHKECSEIQETKALANGSKVVTTNRHVCKEKFNL